MTSAPSGLLEARELLLRHLNIQPGSVPSDLDPAELGIVGDPAHIGGYHCGSDRVLRRAGEIIDYSVVESPRDRAGLSTSASALDIGDFAVTVAGKRYTLVDLSLWLVAQCKADTPDSRDIREIIYSPDGVTVKRWDRLGKRAGGDSSHRWHTHISEFRDARGRNMTALMHRWLAHIGLVAGEEDTVDLATVVYTAAPGNTAAVPAGPRTVSAILSALDSRTALLTNGGMIKKLVDELGAQLDAKLVELAEDVNSPMDEATRAQLVEAFTAAAAEAVAGLNVPTAEENADATADELARRGVE